MGNEDEYKYEESVVVEKTHSAYVAALPHIPYAGNIQITVAIESAWLRSGVVGTCVLRTFDMKVSCAEGFFPDPRNKGMCDKKTPICDMSTVSYLSEPQEIGWNSTVVVELGQSLTVSTAIEDSEQYEVYLEQAPIPGFVPFEDKKTLQVPLKATGRYNLVAAKEKGLPETCVLAEVAVNCPAGQEKE